jgi:hypothetical protein
VHLLKESSMDESHTAVYEGMPDKSTQVKNSSLPITNYVTLKKLFNFPDLHL